jgi:hypothetical protein
MIGCCLSTPVDAAYKIAGGDPPEWLIRGLEMPFLGIDENYHAIRPEISRDEAEAVVIECWRRFHGSVERCHNLWEACRVHWDVCSGEGGDYPPFDEWYPDGDYSWVRDVIERLSAEGA